MNSALPDEATTRNAKLYLDDAFSSDPTLSRMTAIMLLQDAFALMFVEAEAVWNLWKKERFEVTA